MHLLLNIIAISLSHLLSQRLRKPQGGQSLRWGELRYQLSYWWGICDVVLGHILAGTETEHEVLDWQWPGCGEMEEVDHQGRAQLADH